MQKRAATRHAVSIAVNVTAEGQSFESEMQNLSLGGAYVTLGRRLPMGTKVALRFRIPTQEEPISIDAQVRWSTDEGIGVQFGGLRAREVWSLNKYFERF